MTVAKDSPWLFRTYAGHSTAKASNALYRTNLAKGQTGLSVAFDLPTQTGYDSDHELARGEVGKVGVPVAHLGDMRALFEDIPLEQMNTSMTINATAPWLLALYIAAAEEQGADISKLQGTVQNDLIKEYLSRGTYICPPKPSLSMITDVAAYTQKHLPKWNPMNVCSYHLQEAGATPEQELAFALATGGGLVNNVRMADREMVLRVAAFSLLGLDEYYRSDGLDDFLNSVTARIDNGYYDEIIPLFLARFDHSMKVAYGIFGDNAFRKWGVTEGGRRSPINRAIFEAVSTTILTTEDSRLKGVEDIIYGYRFLCSNDPSFIASVTQSTSSAGSVAERFSKIRELMIQ